MMDIRKIIDEAVAVLRDGGVILYPTDTVWGIGCDACNEKAVEKVFAIKHRAGAKSLIVLASDLDMVAKYIGPPIRWSRWNLNATRQSATQSAPFHRQLSRRGRMPRQKTNPARIIPKKSILFLPFS